MARSCRTSAALALSVSDVAGGNIPNITFLTGQASMSAAISGQYRPNPAACNGSTTSGYINNGPQSGSYGNTISSPVGNAGLTMATGIHYNVASSTLPVTGGTFPTNFSGTQGLPLVQAPVGSGSGVFFASTDTSGGFFGVQGMELFIVGHAVLDVVLPLGFADQATAGLTPGKIQFGGVEGGNGGLAGLGNTITPASAPGTIGLLGNTLTGHGASEYPVRLER